MDWAQLQATILGGIAVGAACIIPLTALVMLVIQQYGRIRDLWDQVNHHTRQLNSGIDNRIEAAVSAALEAAQLNKTPSEAAQLAAAASHRVSQTQTPPAGKTA